jgi:hypothetical protein
VKKFCFWFVSDVGCKFSGRNTREHELKCHFLAIRDQLLPMVDELSMLRARVLQQADEIHQLQLDARAPAPSPDIASAPPPIPATIALDDILPEHRASAPQLTYVKKQPPPPDDDSATTVRCNDKALLANQWYHGTMTQDDAEALLNGTSKGTFLVRDSTRSIGVFAFGVVGGGGKVVWAIARPKQQANGNCYDLFVVMLRSMNVKNVGDTGYLFGDSKPKVYPSIEAIVDACNYKRTSIYATFNDESITIHRFECERWQAGVSIETVGARPRSPQQIAAAKQTAAPIVVVDIVER